MKKEITHLLIPGTPAIRAHRVAKDASSAEPKGYYIETWGCQMNEEDSEKLAGMLEQMGYRPVVRPQKAQCIIFNTCCVRENAELKVYGNLGRLKKLKEEHPEIIIAVCGCMMQQKGVGEAILKRYPYVDIVFGTHHAERFPEYLHRALQSGEQIFEVHEDDGTLSEGVPILRESGLKAYVTIMYGCDNYCSYCVVPYVRGREKSRTSEAILAEIRALVAEGYVEFTLLGQNVNSYGKGLEPYVSFAELLRRVNEVPGVSRIRFMTNHPKDIDEEVLKAMVDCEHITEQIHLPVQSGSSRILSRMNRSYTREQYLSLIDRVRTLIPNVAISTDIIVGFPGESEADFQETLSLCEQVGFDAAYTFLYSKRNHTPADRMIDQVPDEIKHERFNRLVEVVNRSAAERNAAYLHRVEEILVEGPSKNRPDTLTGRTRSGKTVNFPGDPSLTSTLQPVRITKTNSFSLFGERLEARSKKA